MKKTYIKIISKKILTTALLMGAAAMEAAAEDTVQANHLEVLSANTASSVEFTGAEDNAFAFDVKIENPDAETLTLEVKNDNGELLFTESYREKAILEKIKILNEEITAHYHFIIRPLNKEAEHSFVVSIITRAEEDTKAA